MNIPVILLYIRMLYEDTGHSKLLFYHFYYLIIFNLLHYDYDYCYLPYSMNLGPTLLCSD